MESKMINAKQARESTNKVLAKLKEERIDSFLEKLSTTIQSAALRGCYKIYVSVNEETFRKVTDLLIANGYEVDEFKPILKPTVDEMDLIDDSFGIRRHIIVRW